MRKWTVAAHAAIVVMAAIGGLVGRASYGISCVYAKQPYGSACSEWEALGAFLQFSLPVAAVFYAVWGIVVFARRANRKNIG